MTTYARVPSRPAGLRAQLDVLKKRAFELEQKKEFNKAIAAYREILQAFDSGAEPNIDVGLYNHVADLLVRQANTPEAVAILDRAVDLYVEGGFFNKAIAVCNKILRTSPGRASAYYKLGKISAAKGVMSDARQHFLEYADRMRKAGHCEEAFRALNEFVDLARDRDVPRSAVASPERTGSRLVFVELGAALLSA